MERMYQQLSRILDNIQIPTEQQIGDWNVMGIYFLETIFSKTDYVFSSIFLAVIYECSGVSLPAFTWQSAPTAHQHYLSINGESSSVPGYSRGICHYEDTRGRTV